MLMDATPATITAMQYSLNRFSTQIGQSDLTVFGTVDAATQARVPMVINYITQRAATTPALLVVASNVQSFDQSTLSTAPDQLTPNLDQAANLLGLPVWTPPLIPTWGWYAIGAGVIYFLYKKKHEHQS